MHSGATKHTIESAHTVPGGQPPMSPGGLQNGNE